MAILTVTKGPAQAEVYAIGDGVTLGRGPHNSIPMPENRGCSRDHAKLWRVGPGKYAVADLGSTNGTLVNDEPTSRCDLEEGDFVQIGQVIFRFELEADEKPKPKIQPREDQRDDFAAILRGEKPRADRPVAAELQGNAAIQIKQRILQYNKKTSAGTQLGWDLSQTSGGRRWLFILLALGAAAGIFFLAMKLVGGGG